MELRPGYKQTEVGVIPEDWDVDSVESVTPRGARNGIVDGPFGSNLKTIHYRKSGIPIVTSGYVTDGKFAADTYLYVDEEKFKEEKRSAVRPGDIVMAKIGARCGASAILPDSHQIGILSGNALKITVDQSRFSTFYVWQVLWTLYSGGRIDELRTVGAQPAISMANLKKYKIPLPPLPQQRAIAAALSDVNALLAKLDQLIAKKRNLKQAAMQQLLTGRTRLPGFSGGWDVKRLGEVAAFHKGKGLAKQELDPFGSEACIHYGELFTKYSETISEVRSRTNTNAGVCRSIANDVLMPTSDVTPNGLATASCIHQTGVVLGGDILIIRADSEKLSGSFLSCVIRQSRDQVLQLVTGTTVFHLYGADMKRFTFSMPTVEEQRAIVKVLDDMDAEIAALEARRGKTRALKQGMMQELLTGRIRLVRSETKPEDAMPAHGQLRKAANDGRNWAFNEAVIISVLAENFADASHPLGRMRYTKLSYLLHRYANEDTEGYLKKAAGPYNPATRYKGPERIAQTSGYVKAAKAGNLHGFVAGEQAYKARTYFDKWYGPTALEWLRQFRYEKNETLELLTTVDKAVEELRSAGKEVTVPSVKEVLLGEPEWKPKLERPMFSDEHIQAAILRCRIDL